MSDIQSKIHPEIKLSPICVPVKSDKLCACKIQY